MTHISAIADDPRPVGSAQHGEARAYLLDQLGSLGWRTEVQESIGMFDFGVDGTQSIAAVANVIATKPGTASTGTVLLTAHYDTVAGSPGAGDDGIGVGVLLETARALSTADAPPEHRDDPADRRRGASGCSARRRSCGSGRKSSGPPSCSTTRPAAPAAPR